MSQALYRKWRPHQWDEVVGQDHVIQTLRNAVTSQRVGHAYLFSGPRGTGKTTTARLLAKAVNCLDPQLANRPCDHCVNCIAVNEGRFLDLIEIDAASNTSVEDIRDLRDKINFSPTQGSFKVYIIDEVHMLSIAAFNALLKTLEEPPSHAIFILATTELQKIPATVLSRCQRHEFRRVPINDILANLKGICEGEHFEIEPEALTLIARQATGSMRDAISLLDQLSSTSGTITLAQAQTVLGTATSQVVIELVEAILKREPAAGLNYIHRALDAGTDPRQFARQVVDYLRNLLLIRMGNADQVDATLDVRAMMAKQADAFDNARLLETLRLFNLAAVDPQRSWQPGLGLEMAFAQSIAENQVVQPVVGAAVEPQTRPATLPPSSQAVQAPAKGAPEALDWGAAQPAAQKASAPAPAAAKPAPVAASTPTGQPAPGEVNPNSLLAVTQNWAKIRTLVKQRRGQTEALLNSCKPLGIKDDALILGFSSELLKSKMEMGDNLQVIRQALTQVLGKELQVICTITGAKSKTLPNDLNVETDGMVGTALRDLGGEITDIK